MSGFVHLHNHTHYSVLDASPTPEELIQAAVRNGHDSLALTDHGVMFGVLNFYMTAKEKYDIKPIIGMEAYVANNSRHDRTLMVKGKKETNYFHLILLAKDTMGYKNLMKLTSIAHTEGFYYRPRIDRELLEKYKDGLIASSACIGGVVNTHLIQGNEEKAYEAARYYRDLFEDDFYLELQNHFTEKDEIIMNKVPLMAKELGIKLVATNDIHYINKEDAVSHNVQLLIRDASIEPGKTDINKLKYGTPELYYKSTEQMKEIFKFYPESIANTIEIADKCNCNIETGKYHMPNFNIPEESNATKLSEYLEELVWKGIKERYDPVTHEIEERTRYELRVINDMDFPGYFLITSDFINAAKKLNVRVGPGRGSAAGSIVAYALGITNVDPLPYNLLFERFLNPERVSMPDIDIDFADDKRDVVFNYVKEKYGDNAVAQIITFGKMSSKAVLNDVSRVIGVPLQSVREITKKIPSVFGKVYEIADAIELPELKWLKESTDPKYQLLLKLSLFLEGKIRNVGTHAAGVIIAPGDITEFIPVYQSPRSKGQSVEIATQYNMIEAEEVGLLKMDFLGLKTLSIIENTLTMIEKNHGKKIDIDEIDFKDKKTYDMISAGDTLAVFQFESSGMQEYLKQLKPHNLEELTAINALYRPGPMANIPEYIARKHGKADITYLHPIMEKSLKNTYGIIVYQEQVMQLVQDIAGFSLGQADILRRAMGKKKVKLMDQLKPLFVEGAAKNGIDKRMALEIFDLIKKFASYGFNKSHSLAYSYLAFQTAWLKANYTAEFLAANMTNEINELTKIVELIDSAKYNGIKVLAPDINVSHAEFFAIDNVIYFGMAGIKNVGVSAVNSIVRAREDGPFRSFFDFVSRVDIRLINKRTLESLICAGAFDSLDDGHRAAYFASIDSALEYAHSMQDNSNDSMDSLFEDDKEQLIVEPKLQDAAEWTEKERLQKEKEFLNFYVSGHPLNRFVPYVNTFSNITKESLAQLRSDDRVKFCGIITDIRTTLDRKKNTIAFVIMEDMNRKVECIFWNDSYKNYSQYLLEDTVVVVSGKLKLDNFKEDSQDKLQIQVDSVDDIDNLVAQKAAGYKLWLDINKHNPLVKLQELKNLENKSAEPIEIVFNTYKSDSNYQRRFVSQSIKLATDRETTRKLMKIFGSFNVQFSLKD